MAWIVREYSRLCINLTVRKGNYMKDRKTIDSEDFNKIIIGLNTICRSLSEGICSYTARGILTKSKILSEEQNAITYITDYADLISGVIEVMAGFMGVIADGVDNDELTISAKD